MFITCADNLRRDSVQVNLKRYLIEMIRKIGSGAVPFSVTFEKKVKRKIQFFDDKPIIKTRKAMTENENVKIVENIKKIVNCDEFILTKKLEEFKPFSKGYDKETEQLFNKASEKVLKEASNTVVKVISFVIDWVKKGSKYQEELKEDGDFDDFGPEITITKAFEKITGKKIESILSDDFGKAKLSSLFYVAKEIVKRLKTRSWLFNDDKIVSAKLPDNIVEQLEKIKDDVFANCKNELEKIDKLEKSIDKISSIMVREKNIIIRNKTDKGILDLVEDKVPKLNKDLLKKILPREIKLSCYKEYMRWLFNLLFELRMILPQNEFVPDNVDDDDEVFILKENETYSELVDGERTKIPAKEQSKDNENEDDDDDDDNDNDDGSDSGGGGGGDDEKENNMNINEKGHDTGIPKKDDTQESRDKNTMNDENILKIISLMSPDELKKWSSMTPEQRKIFIEFKLQQQQHSSIPSQHTIQQPQQQQSYRQEPPLCVPQRQQFPPHPPKHMPHPPPQSYVPQHQCYQGPSYYMPQGQQLVFNPPQYPPYSYSRPYIPPLPQQQQQSYYQGQPPYMPQVDQFVPHPPQHAPHPPYQPYEPPAQQP